MRKILAFISTLLFFFSTCNAHASYESNITNSKQITVPTYPLVINGHSIDYQNSIYPVISYENITYFPMTWHYCRMLGLVTEWNEKIGLCISKQQTSSEVPIYESFSNEDALFAVDAEYDIYINGKKFENCNTKYPILNFRYVTYFPMTWELMVDEFGWNYSFDSSNGLIVNSAKTPDTYDKKLENFRVIGYYSGDLFDEPIHNLRVDKLTHVMYAFLIPKSDGTCLPFSKPDKVKSLISYAHENGCKVYVAVGGWSHNNIPLASTFETITSTPDKCRYFIENIMNVVEDYGFDGVELDWEYPTEHSAKNYEALVLELSDELRKSNKNLTAALNGAWSETEGPKVSEYVTEACLNAFEFISVMSYDMNNEQHSPFWFANTSVEYWLHRNLPKDKIVLGMPLYARPTWIQYRHLIESNPNAAFVDEYSVNGTVSYYNGLPTLCKKTLLAVEKAGGVMLFDVNEDTNDSYSVVAMIDRVLTDLKQNNRISNDMLNFLRDNGGTEELKGIVSLNNVVY